MSRVFPFLVFTAVSSLCVGAMAQEVSRATWAPAAAGWLESAKVATWGAPKVQGEGAQASVQFNGVDDAYLVPGVPIAGMAAFTIEVLIAPVKGGAEEQRFLHIQDERGPRVLMELRLIGGDKWCLDTFLFQSQTARLTLIERGKLHAADEWHWVALTYAEGKMRHYVDGKLEAEGEIHFDALQAAGQTSLGVRQNKVSWFKGGIREVRFHAAALAAEQLAKGESQEVMGNGP